MKLLSDIDSRRGIARCRRAWDALERLRLRANAGWRVRIERESRRSARGQYGDRLPAGTDIDTA